MRIDPQTSRDDDLRRWRAQFTDATPVGDLRPRQRATCVGVVYKIRLVPGQKLEIGIEDGSGRLTGIFHGRTNLPGLELGMGLRLTGTVAVDAEGERRILNPSWAPVVEPYN